MTTHIGMLLYPGLTQRDPEPPFRSGHPDVAEPALVAAVREGARS